VKPSPHWNNRNLQHLLDLICILAESADIAPDDRRVASISALL